MKSAAPLRKHIVLVGGGHAHVTVIRSLGMQPEPGVLVTVISRELEAPYSGMLPGYVAGHYSYDDCHIDLVRLASWAGARVIHGTVNGIDRSSRRVEIEGRPPLSYDLLSIDVGITPQLDAIAGAAQHGIAVKPVSTFAARWRALEQAATATSGPRRIAVIGTGAAGFELVLAARHRLVTEATRRGLDPSRFEFTLIGGSKLLPTHNARAQRLAKAALDRDGVRLLEHTRVTRIDTSGLDFETGTRLYADAVLLATNAGPAPWLAKSGMPVDAKGFLAVRPTLQLMDDDDVFAVGDCATVIEHPREKAGVFAVRQGPPLTENLRRRARDLPAQPFVPQKEFLTLLSTGRRHAIAARNGLTLSGDWVWRWKDRIDREFMDRFSDLPAMHGHATVEADDAALRCAGCAAKVGPVTLSRALARLVPAEKTARDDAAVIDEGGDALRLETIDFFRALWPEPYVLGEIAAVHAMSDIYAMGGRPHRALANAVLPHAASHLVEEDLFQLLAGAGSALARDGARLAGGHTSEGRELAAGFFVSGSVARGALLQKGGLKAGDALILTRPIGTGILFAALMRDAARGRDISYALSEMQRSNARAAGVLGEFGATAATDVTGFGLAGHLIEMLEASAVAAEIDMSALPLMPSAAALAARGFASSLLPENLRTISWIADAAKHSPASLALLFDPQTSGGLLAGIPRDFAEKCVDALRKSGEPGAAIIGKVTAGTPRLTVTGAPRGEHE